MILLWQLAVIGLIVWLAWPRRHKPGPWLDAYMRAAAELEQWHRDQHATRRRLP